MGQAIQINWVSKILCPGYQLGECSIIRYLMFPPSHEPMGRVNLNWVHYPNMKFYLLEDTNSLSLMNPDGDSQFKRSILETTIPIGVGATVPTWFGGNTHLSAFSGGDGTLNKPPKLKLDWIDSRRSAMDFDGDFNYSPQVITPLDLVKMLNYTQMLKIPLKTHSKVQACIPRRSSEARTYLPRAGEPDRKIDYIFYGGPVEIESARYSRSQ